MNEQPLAGFGNQFASEALVVAGRRIYHSGVRCPNAAGQSKAFNRFALAFRA